MLRRGKVLSPLPHSHSQAHSHSHLQSPPTTADDTNTQRDNNKKSPIGIPTVERMATLGVPVHDGELPVPTFAYSGTWNR